MRLSLFFYREILRIFYENSGKIHFFGLRKFAKTKK